MLDNKQEAARPEKRRPSVIDIASYCHAKAARPLLGFLDHDADTMLWSSGGADFSDLLAACGEVTSLTNILLALGVSVADAKSAVGAVASLRSAEPLTGSRIILTALGGREYALFFRRRADEHAPLQFTLSDQNAFVRAAGRQREMAKKIMEVLDGGEPPPLTLLSRIGRDFDLMARTKDAAVVTQAARKLAGYADLVIAACTGVLRQFEGDDAHHDADAAPVANQVVPFSWHEIVQAVDRKEINVQEIDCAASFIQAAIPLFLLAPPGGGIILVLNGRLGGTSWHDIPSLMKQLEVGENSVRTASDFFEGLAKRPDHASFAAAGANVEARGRPLSGGGWQALLMPSMSDTIDVRGFFHGFKNLLLHMQILYVLRTPRDVAEVGGALHDTFRSIDERIALLRQISQTGRMNVPRRAESVSQWTAVAERVAEIMGKQISLSIPLEIMTMTYSAIPDEMADAFAEIARNAFQHGAERIKIVARKTDFCVMFMFADDGKGMDDSKLNQVREVLKTLRHDPELSTRVGGTGNGLRSAAVAVRRFVDGSLSVEQGQNGRGTVFTITIAQPDATETSSIFP